jgi:hypothetical protein
MLDISCRRMLKPLKSSTEMATLVQLAIVLVILPALAMDTA